MVRDIHYARVADAARGTVQQQFAACAAISAQDGSVVVGQFADRGTGLLAEQQGLRAAVELMRTGQADRLIVLRWDCLGRARGQVGRIIQDLLSRGLSLVSCTEGEMDRDVANVVARVGQWDSGAYTERKGP